MKVAAQPCAARYHQIEVEYTKMGYTDGIEMIVSMSHATTPTGTRLRRKHGGYSR